MTLWAGWFEDEKIGNEDIAFRFGKLNFRLDSGSTVFQETTPGGFLFCTQEAYTV
ncbi:hypothetical protein E4U30_006648 [Claviceps sp. LM220 group G6]|nr:hypothetical protein E4U31_006261 [Claviceps sp. LM219 group G6]KAG6102410.1 hypothetical protein E4U30_006648 [Claviceps sp. LM220 group G6]